MILIIVFIYFKVSITKQTTTETLDNYIIITALEYNNGRIVPNEHLFISNAHFAINNYLWKMKI